MRCPTRRYGPFVGPSSGANLAAAEEVKESLFQPKDDNNALLRRGWEVYPSSNTSLDLTGCTSDEEEGDLA